MPKKSDIIQFEVENNLAKVIYTQGDYACSNMLSSNGEVTFKVKLSNTVSTNGIKCKKSTASSNEESLYVVDPSGTTNATIFPGVVKYNNWHSYKTS